MQVSELLKQGRLSVNLSQREVADAFGYTTPQFVSNWERGVSHPPLSALAKLSKLLKIDYKLIHHSMLQETMDDVKAKFAAYSQPTDGPSKPKKSK